MTTNYKLNLGDNLATLKTYPDNHFDSIVTDPPYGIDFLGKEWDSHTGTVELYKECLRVLKPGGYLLAFSAARTYHKLAYSVELAGFEIRDQLMWLYSSGFPKAQDIGKAIQKRIGVEETTKIEDNGRARMANKLSDTNDGGDPGFSGLNTICTSPIAKEWEGYKTALKPAHEPIVMARKPFKGSTIDNVLKNGLGAMNIDATRVPWADEKDAEQRVKWDNAYSDIYNGSEQFNNLLADSRGIEKMPSPKKKKSDKVAAPMTSRTMDTHFGFKEYVPEETNGRYPSNVIGEVEEGYQKYFYCPKVSRKERHIGFGEDSDTQESMVTAMGGHFIDENGPTTKACSNRIWLPQTGEIFSHGIKHEYAKWAATHNITLSNVGNNHPTVKPVALMEYLIKLVTPPSTPTLQRKVLDPFMGSGSTGMAATKLGHHFTGCELDPKYVAIAETRINAWSTEDEIVNEDFERIFGDK